MKRKHAHIKSGAVADPAGSYHMPRGMKRLAAAIFLAAFIPAAALFPTAGLSQTLDEAVNAQLEMDGSGNPCFRLIPIGDTSMLTGPLKSICQRSLGASLIAISDSSGGGAGTPTTLPGIVKERMEGEEEADEDSAVIELGRTLNLFVSAEYEALDREVTTFEAGYESDIRRLTIGADLQATASLVLGLAFDTSLQKGDFVGDGGFENESYGVIAFGSFLPTERSFVQVYGGYASMSNERERPANFSEFYDASPPFIVTGTPEADFEADRYTAGLLVGYDLPLGALTIGPRAGVDWSRIEYDTYSETDSDGLSGLELTFHDDEESSLLTTLGLTAAVTGSTDFGVVVAQQSIYYKHESDQDQRDVEVSFVGDTRANRFAYQTEKPHRDFFEFNAGIVFVLPRGVQAFANYRTLFGHEFFDSHAGTVGLRVEL